MNMGFTMCITLMPAYLVFGLFFAILKEKGAKFVSGFNNLSEAEQELYDKAYISRDMRNSFFWWAFIMFAGAMCSLISGYFAIIAFIIWGMLFFKNVHLDARKAFKKYLR